MKPTKKARKALVLLKKWQHKNMVYNQFLHEIDAFIEFEEFDYLDEWFGFDFEEYYDDRFLSFAGDGSGGEYCLWYYPDLDGEPPVVFIGSEGEINLIAPTLEDFVLLFTSGKILDARKDEIETPQDLWREMYSFEAEDFANNLGLSLEESQEELSKSVAKFKNFVYAKIEEKPLETIFSEIEKQPNFVTWVDAIRDKHEDEAAIPDVEEDPLTLNLSYEDLTKIPQSVLDNLEIETLNLSNNNITEIPEFVSKLKKLKSLDLSSNEITEIPKFFEEFEHLEYLYLQYNNIKELKLDFTKMKSLTILNIYENPDFEFIDPTIFKSTSLVSIDYEDTLLEESLPQLSFIEKSSSEHILAEISEIASDMVEEDETYVPRIEAIFKRWIELTPNFESYYSYGFFIQYTRKTNYEEAKEFYLKAIENNGDINFMPVVYTHLAKIYYYHLEENELAEKYYKKAIKLDKESEFALEMYISFVIYHKEDYKEANKLYKRLIKLDPNDTDNLEEYADFLKYKLDVPKKALKVFKRLREIKPTSKRYLKRYAETLAFDLNKPEKALKKFKKLLKKKPSKDNYWNYITALQDAGEDSELIIKLFEEGKERHPKDDFLNNDYYSYLLEIGKDEKVEELINSGVANEKVFSQYIQHLLYNNEEKSKSLIEKALEQFPNSERILGLKLSYLTKTKADNSEILAIAKQLLTLTEDEKQIKRLELVIASKETIDEESSKFDALIASKNGEIEELVKSAGEAFSEKEFEKALALLKAIEKIDPYQSEMLSMQYSLLKVNQNETVAIDFLKDKLDEKKPNVNVLLQLIKVYIQAENDDETIKYVEIAQKHFPENNKVVKMVAFVKSLKITATSEEEFEELLKNNPNDTTYLQAYADFLFDDEKHKKAIKLYEKIIELDKESIITYINISMAYSMLNNSKKEEAYINEAIEIDPLKTLSILMSVSPFSMKKYMEIAVEKFPDNTQLVEWVTMVRKIM